MGDASLRQDPTLLSHLQFLFLLLLLFFQNTLLFSLARENPLQVLSATHL